MIVHRDTNTHYTAGLFILLSMDSFTMHRVIRTLYGESCFSGVPLTYA